MAVPSLSRASRPNRRLRPSVRIGGRIASARLVAIPAAPNVLDGSKAAIMGRKRACADQLSKNKTTMMATPEITEVVQPIAFE